MVRMQVVAIFAILVVVSLPRFARSTEYMVGDHSGWTLNFNYSAWAEGKDFRVGDTLVFKYPVGKHNVYRVDGPMFDACSVPAHWKKPMTTGKDVIHLATPGRKWYLCGVNYGKHCKMGMRLFVKVQAAAAATPPSPKYPSPSPSPPTTTGPTKHIVGDQHGWTLNFNYTKWAEKRVFRVGDSLVFKYHVGMHNVYKVADAHMFQACSVPHEQQPMTTGYDVINLETPGRKWYLCGVAKHCQMGMRLFINVHPAVLAPPPPSYYSSPSPPAPAMKEPPTHHLVGDDQGWKLNFDYAAWAKGKTFRVGDTITFKYSPGMHNVFKLVTQSDFNACMVPPNDHPMITGNDLITLATSGTKWYICGVSGHCTAGMKVAINVLP